MFDRVVIFILLFHEDLSFRSLPGSCPVFIGPAKGKRKVRPAGLKHFVERPLEKQFPVEPIVVIAKTADAMPGGQICLGDPCFFQSKVVISQVVRYVGLMMPGE
jgi:hypothetical protein